MVPGEKDASYSYSLLYGIYQTAYLGLLSKFDTLKSYGPWYLCHVYYLYTIFGFFMIVRGGYLEDGFCSLIKIQLERIAKNADVNFL